MKLIDPVKTAYDRLYRKGMKFSRDQIRSAFDEMGMDQLNANSEQVDCIVQSLVKNQNQIVLQITEEIVETDNDVHNFDETKDSYTDNGNEDSALEQMDKPEGSLVLTQSQKISMVENQSSVLGVQLNNDQIHTTASMMVGNYSSFVDSVDEVKSLIIQVLNQQRDRAEEKLVNSLNEIADTASAGFDSLTERSERGFSLIMGQLKDQETDFKSRTGSLKDQLRQLLT